MGELCPTIDGFELFTIEILDDRRDLGILIHGECEVVDDGNLIRSWMNERSVSRMESMGDEGHLPGACRLRLVLGRIVRLEAMSPFALRSNPLCLSPYPDRRRGD